MSEEKKLSKDEAIKKFFPSVDDTTFGRQFIGGLYGGGFAIIESSAQEPSRDKSLDVQYVKLLEEAKRLGVGEKEFIEKVLQSYPQEPSEAEMEEFVEKWADIVTPVVLINNEMRPQLMKAMQKDLINMLKEYEQLKRGIQNG